MNRTRARGNRLALRNDVIAAVVATAIVLIVSPGLAISGLIAIIALLICGVSLLRDSRADRRLRWRARVRARTRAG